MTVEVYVGECTTVGYHYVDHRLQARIKSPAGLAASNESIFVSLYHDHRVLGVMKSTDFCNLRVEMSESISYLTLDSLSNVIYVGITYGVARKELNKAGTSPEIVLSASGRGVGRFNETSFGDVRGLLILDHFNLLLCDQNNKR